MFLIDKNKGVSCHANDVTFGSLIRIGDGCQKNQPYDYRVGTFSPKLFPSASEEGREHEGCLSCQWPIINQSWFCKSLLYKHPRGHS